MSPLTILRRARLPALAAALFATAACQGDSQGWHGTWVGGSTPSLAFRLTRASDGHAVTQADYRGKVVLLYFGYTYCPDVCPATLSRLAQALAKVPDAAQNVRVLFVTVDPNRDTLPVLKQYVAAFGPEFEGLRGSEDALATAAKRYRIAYSVTPDADPAKYEVTHSSAIYAFDRQGAAKLLFTSLSTTTPDVAGTAADIARLEKR